MSLLFGLFLCCVILGWFLAYLYQMDRKAQRVRTLDALALERGMATYKGRRMGEPLAITSQWQAREVSMNRRNYDNYMQLPKPKNNFWPGTVARNVWRDMGRFEG